MQAGDRLSVQESFDFFIRKCAVRNLSPKTINLHKDHFRVFCSFLNSYGQTMDDISLNTVEDFIIYLKDTRQCKDVTVNSYLRNIRSFLYFCMAEGFIKDFKIRLIKVTKGIKETYTDTELKALLKKPNIKTCDFTEYKIWAYSNYLLATGNRISSVLDLKIGDLDFDGGVIQVNRTKNRKAQIIPMSAALTAVMKEYLIYRKGDTDDYLFCNSCGEHADVRTYQDMLAGYNKRRGVSKTSAHLYRHTFAKKWILNGGDIFRLQKVLGHSDLAMVREYVNMFGNDMTVDFDKYNPLDNMDCQHKRYKIMM